jgi:hypothetical protein
MRRPLALAEILVVGLTLPGAANETLCGPIARQSLSGEE